MAEVRLIYTGELIEPDCYHLVLGWESKRNEINHKLQNKDEYKNYVMYVSLMRFYKELDDRVTILNYEEWLTGLIFNKDKKINSV